MRCLRLLVHHAEVEPRLVEHDPPLRCWRWSGGPCCARRNQQPCTDDGGWQEAVSGWSPLVHRHLENRRHLTPVNPRRQSQRRAASPNAATAASQHSHPFLFFCPNFHSASLRLCVSFPPHSALPRKRLNAFRQPDPPHTPALHYSNPRTLHHSAAQCSQPSRRVFHVFISLFADVPSIIPVM